MHLIPTVSASALPVTGPRRLLYAMIEDLFALRDLKLITPVRRQHRRDEEWLASDQEEPFTFLWVCQHLDISPLCSGNGIVKGRHWRGEYWGDVRGKATIGTATVALLGKGLIHANRNAWEAFVANTDRQATVKHFANVLMQLPQESLMTESL